MKFVWSRSRALLIGAALIVVTNAIVLAGVGYNRSGEPESTLRLTERELRIRHWSWPENENSSIDLHLDWRVPDGDGGDYYTDSWYGVPLRLDAEALRQFGFEVSGDLQSEEVRRRLENQPAKTAWFVLEQEGPAYHVALDRAKKQRDEAEAQASSGDGGQDRLESARKRLEVEQQRASRLFVVHVAAEQEGLRARYPDRRMYVIVRGAIKVVVAGNCKGRHLSARIDQISVDAIRVPHAYREIVEPFAESREYAQEREPRYVATVNFGQRLEPWIADLALLE